MPFLQTLVILLAASVLTVPLAKRLGFGSVLGYLAAGLLIGPAALRLVTDVDDIAHVAELGVVMLLFVIGLELRPARLWLMRRSVLGLGGGQFVLTTAALYGLARLVGVAPATALIIAAGVALSSTAIVLPMLAERGLLANQVGRDGFAILLLQDLAIIPLVAAVPLLAGGGEPRDGTEILRALGDAVLALVLMLIGGRYLVRPLFRLVDSARLPEVFTAATLLLVAGTAAGFAAIGLSMSLGAFVAGVLMSDSEYRHQLKADIDPFQGLLLGFFFISVGAQTDVARLLADPGFVLAGAAVLVLVKAIIVFALTRATTQTSANAMRLAVALAQGSEFGFVLFTAATEAGAMSGEDARLASLVVTLSMLASPVLFALQERFLVPLLDRGPERDFDAIDETNPVIICGIGRVGQIVARILQSQRIPFTALDNDAGQVDAVRRFGNKAYYGDSTRPELLRAAGAEHAKVLVLALDDGEKSVEVVRMVKRHFPHLKLVVRARNRRHAHLLMDLGVRHIIRETFYSSLMMGDQVLEMLEIPTDERVRILQTFQRHDERTLVEQHAIYQDEKQLIQTSRQAAEELRGILAADLRDSDGRGTPAERGADGRQAAGNEPERLDPPAAAR